MRTATMNHQPEPITSPGGFKFEAIQILRTAINQRRILIYKRRSNLHTSARVVSVFNMYDAFKNNWKPQGVARFLLKYEATIRLIIPSTNPPLMQRLDNILPIAKRFANLN